MPLNIFGNVNSAATLSWAQPPNLKYRENNVYKITYGTKYSRMDQVKSVEDSL